jgi:hypothetical protein
MEYLEFIVTLGILIAVVRNTDQLDFLQRRIK